MIRIRKTNGDWQVRWRRFEGDKRTWHWGSIKNIYELQQIVIEFAVHIDNYVRDALEVMQGRSETYLYQDGKLIRRNPRQPISVDDVQYFCATMEFRYHDEVEETIQLIETGVWKVRKWVPPPIFAERNEFRITGDKIKRQYLIVETRDDSFVPFEVII